MKKLNQIYLAILLSLSMGLFTNSLFAQDEKMDDVSTILNRYATDYETDVTFTNDVLFGVKVDDQFWHIDAQAQTDSTSAIVQVLEGKPQIPTFYFYTDIKTLNKIDQGKLNALTGAAKAFSNEFAPFDADVMEGYVPDDAFMPTLFSVFFHFWTRGMPEVIPYGIDLTRFTHGAQASIFYYQEGFRSGYVAIKKGQHANANEDSKTNPFPTLLIAINGEGVAIINGVKSKFEKGQALLIPPHVSHEFLNPDHDEPLECILLMFGKGA